MEQNHIIYWKKYQRLDIWSIRLLFTHLRFTYRKVERANRHLINHPPTEIDLWDILFLFLFYETILFPFNLFWGVIWHKIHWLLLTFSHLGTIWTPRFVLWAKDVLGTNHPIARVTRDMTFSGVTYWILLHRQLSIWYLVFRHTAVIKTHFLSFVAISVTHFNTNNIS